VNWLKRVWSVIWAEPRRSDQVFNVNSTNHQTNELEDLPLGVETKLYQIFLSSDWIEKESGDAAQYCFHHKEFNIDLVISHMALKIPQDLLKEGAENLLSTQMNAVDHLKKEMGVSPLSGTEDLVEQSWGYQVSVSRTYRKYETFLFTGFVSPNLILNITFEGQDAVVGSFDSAVTLVLSGIRFSEKVWGERDSSLAPTVH